MPLLGLLDQVGLALRAGPGGWGGEQDGGVGVVEEAGLEPGLVGGVLQQAADEVGHAGDHLADGDVLADAQAHAGAGVLELVGHAVEHLEFNGLAGELAALEPGEGGRDGADVVRAEGELDPALAGLARAGIEEDLDHVLEAAVGLPLLVPDRARPALLLGVDGLIVPIRALDQADGHHAPGAPGPVGDPLGVVHTGLEVGLHGQAGLEVEGLAGVHEGVEGQVLERELLHVEVDQHAVALGRCEDGLEAAHQVVDGRLGGDGVELGAEAGDLDGHIDARDGSEVVLLEAVAGLPAGGLAHEVLDQVEVLGLVGVGLGA